MLNLSNREDVGYAVVRSLAERCVRRCHEHGPKRLVMPFLCTGGRLKA